MKKLLLIFILILSIPTFAQYHYKVSPITTIGINLNIGNIGSMGVNWKNIEVQGMHHLSTLAKYPFIANVNYHTGVVFLGWGTEGLSAGVQFQKKQYMLRAGVAGNYGYVTVGANSYPKQKFKLFTKNDQLLILTSLGRGYMRGWREAIQANHWGTGQFWDNRVSWKNKYKADGHTPRFPGSTTWAVGITDGYHLTNVGVTVFDAGILITALMSKDGWEWKTIAKKMLLSIGSESLAFYIAYEKIYK